jgi:hypothetical protein
MSGKVIYAMLVSEKMSLQKYDERSGADWPFRIPDVSSKSLVKRLGDCIYDYSRGTPPRQRLGVHSDINSCIPFVIKPKGTKAFRMRPRFLRLLSGSAVSKLGK